MFLHKFVLYNLLILCVRTVKIVNKPNLYNSSNKFTIHRNKIKNDIFFINHSCKNAVNGFYDKIDNNLITHENVLEDSTEIPYNNSPLNFVFYSTNDSNGLNYADQNISDKKYNISTGVADIPVEYEQSGSVSNNTGNSQLYKAIGTKQLNNTYNNGDTNFLLKDVESKLYTCAFDGHESLSNVLETLSGPLETVCTHIHNEHKQRFPCKINDNFEFSAFRSIRALIYLVGSRLLNIAKIARKHSNLQCESDELDAENEKCEETIRSFVSTNVEQWEKLLTNTKDFGMDSIKYPRFTSSEESLEYIKGVWKYFNIKIFNNLLPSCDLKFSFYKSQNLLNNAIVRTRELFIINRTNLLEFPEILYPNELNSLPSSLGNCVFRSMVKLFLDIYSPFDLVDTVTTVLNGFRFVESGTGQSDLNFTVIQSPLDKLVEYNPDLMAQINSDHFILEEESDLNDPKSISSSIDLSPFLPNSFLPITNTKINYVENDNVNGVSEVVANEFYKLFDQSFKKRQGIDNFWFRGDDVVVPVRDIKRALLMGGFEQFTGLFTPVMNKLMELKPVELNFIQNRIITVCVDFLNSLVSLQNYSLNYSLTRNPSVNDIIERANLEVVQCILFVMGLHQKCTTNLNLYPLANDFIRTSFLTQLLSNDEITVNKDNNDNTEYKNNTINTIDNIVGNGSNSGSDNLGLVYKKYLGQNEEFVSFINEYLDDSVPSDDPDALKFLVNYYNFNLFSGRLPINIGIKFVSSDYLSSNDACGILRTPTIYINDLVKRDKIIVSRVILDEMLRIFLKYCSKLTFNEGSTGLEDMLESNLENRMKQHFLISTNDSFPFQLLDLSESVSPINDKNNFVENDNVSGVSRGELNRVGPDGLMGKGYKMCKNRLTEVFKSSLGPDNFVYQLHKSLVTEDLDKIWLEKRLPISRFLSSLVTGNFHLSHSVISNPASIKVTSKLKLTQLNLLENKFKHHITAYHHLIRELSRHNNITSLIWESLVIVDLAFSDLREELIKNILIYTQDLIEAITNILNTFTNTTKIHDLLDYNIKIRNNIVTDNAMDNTVNNISKVDNTDSNYSITNTSCGTVDSSSVENKGNVSMRKETGNDLFDLINQERLTRDELQGVIQLLYDRYNKYIFGGVLPDVEIQFVPLGELSELSIDFTTFSAPKILINHLLTEINLINSQLVIQMCHLSYYYYRHNVSEELGELGIHYTSVYNLIHSNNERIIKSKLIPFTIEKKLAKTKEKKTFNQNYIDLITNTIGKNNNPMDKNTNYLNWLVEDFVVEVILSRKELKHDERYTNFYEDYHTLKSFATHYFNSKLGLEITDPLEQTNSQSTQNKQNAQDKQDISVENDNVTVFPEGPITEDSSLEILDMMKNNWLKNMLAKFEKKLHEKGIKLFLNLEEFDWNSLLTDEQQERVVNYIAKHPEQSLFSILTKSNALTQQQVINIFTRNTDYPPQNSTRNFIDNSKDDSIQNSAQNSTQNSKDDRQENSVSLGVNYVNTVNSEEFNLDPEVQKTSIDVEELISNILMDVVYQLPDHEHETFLNFFNKLLDQDFVYCRNILNSHETPSLLLKRAFEALESIHHHQIVDEDVRNNILNFLHM